MRLLIVQTGNKRITRRINIATISCIETNGDKVIVYYADSHAILSGGAPLADHICRELTTDKKIIDVRTTDFVEPAEISQEKIKA